MGFRQDDYREKLAMLASQFPMTLMEMAAICGRDLTAPMGGRTDQIRFAVEDHAETAIMWAKLVLSGAASEAEKEARRLGIRD